ncbi:Sulfate transporter 4.1 [Heterostelium album PN500]|uniref:Sulfate transporter 4.1 n=1 Tax=Heterostelium pallidum (strain ATCC 26659 / Pp 5 / PN500) TaxID=670386 RepID=D3BR11_HETP5|nr:Sulfate transporter 4.1 [Heterostelium album PN500]EFA76197.1 Sulfate transporter 4.1 [Heterostelium album PN500]|eukprot:XP_020428330.1 Sulfate transporter 4.1 [Heterostelium album PN500]
MSNKNNKYSSLNDSGGSQNDNNNNNSSSSNSNGLKNTVILVNDQPLSPNTQQQQQTGRHNHDGADSTSLLTRSREFDQESLLAKEREVSESMDLYYVPPSKLNQSLRISQPTSPYYSSVSSPKVIGSGGRQKMPTSSVPPVDLDSAIEMDEIRTDGSSNAFTDHSTLKYASGADHDPTPHSFTPTLVGNNDDDIFMSTIRQIRQFKFEKKHKKRFIHYLLGLLPIVSWLPKYNIKNNLRGDIIAGLTVGVMLIPQGMAYAMVAELPSVYGLYSSIVPIFVYCIFGTSRELSMGPFAIISLLVLETVNGEVGIDNHDMERRVTVSILLAFVCGVYQIIFGLLRFGFVANFLSDPVKTGFISGCAIIISSSQIKHIFGIYSGIQSSNFLPLLLIRYLIEIKRTNWWSVLIAFAGIAFLFAIKKVNSRYKLKLPGPLLIVVILTFISWVFDLEKRAHISTVGVIPSNFPSPTFPTIRTTEGYPESGNWFNVVVRITPGALVLVLVGFISSVSVSTKIAEKEQYPIDANQELLALGMSDFIGSFFLSFPIGASLSRTAVNLQSGAKSQISGFITAVIIIFSLFFLTRVIMFLPRSILASIVVVAVADLIEVKIALDLWKVHRRDLMLYLISFLSTIFLGILQGIMIGIVCSLLLIIYKSAYPPFAELGRLPGTELYKNIKRVPQAETFKGIKVVRIDGSIYFANTQYIKKKLRQYEPTKKSDRFELSDSETDLADVDGLVTVDIDGNPTKGAIIIDCSSMNDIDSTGLRMLREFVEEFKHRQLVIYYASIKGYIRDLLKKGGVVDTLGANHFFWTVNDAVEHHLYLMRQGRRNFLSNSSTLTSPLMASSKSVETEEQQQIEIDQIVKN